MWYVLIFFISAYGSIYTPEQVRLAWTDLDTSMSVLWAADAPSTGASVEYTPVASYNDIAHSFAFSAAGIWTTFPNNGHHILQRQLHVCRAYMVNLVQGGLYAYRVGSNVYGWSPQFIFQAKKDYSQNPLLRMIVYGDLSAGIENVATVARLKQEIETHEYDAIIHNGDIAYNLDDNSGRVGDEFFRNIEPLSSRLPYLVTQGNHENDSTLENYMNRFQMPGNTSGLWYSFNAGLVHFIAYDTELVYQDQYSYLQPQMMEFIQNDIDSYDKEKYPWLIVFGHKMMYCSADWSNPNGREYENPLYEMLGHKRFYDCTTESTYLRGIFEDVWYNNKVDMVIASHIHAYERLGPAYNNQSMPCEVETDNNHTCIGASAPIYPVTGVPGTDDGYDPPSPIALPFSKAQDGKLGFSRLTVFNRTHLLWEEVRSVTMEVSDYLWLIKGTSKPAQVDS